MSVNRLLKKRRQEGQQMGQTSGVQATQSGNFIQQQPKLSQNEAKLEEQFQSYAELSQYNPPSYQYSNSYLPSNGVLYNRFRLPISIALSPVSYEMQPQGKSIDKIPRCGVCRAYMNYYNQIKKNMFVCFVCGRQNSLMGNYEHDQQSIQLTQPSYHVLGGENIYTQAPPQNAFIFMVDVSSSSAQSRMLYYFVAAMKQVLAREQLNQTQIYFYTYDDVVHEYDFTGSEVKCTVFDPSITIASGKPADNFLMNIREKLFQLLDTLEQLSQNNKKQGSNFYQSFAYIYQSTKHTGGKMFIFQTNEAIIGEEFMNENVKTPEDQPRPKSFLESKNKMLFSTYIHQFLNENISFSLFVFQKSYKNLRVFSDIAKLTTSEINAYRKQSPEDLMKFYYDLVYLLGSTYYTDVRMQLVMSPGWFFAAVYGNLYRIKQYIQFKYCHLNPQKKTYIVIQPQDNTQLPYFCLQVITNYIYNRQHFVTVNTVVLPLTGNLNKLYEGQDFALAATTLQRIYMSSIRLQEINILRNKFIKHVAAIYKVAIEHYKKVFCQRQFRYLWINKQKTPDWLNTLMLSQLAYLKSLHFQLQSINDTLALDTVITQRNFLQASGVHQLQNFFNPYLFNLSNMTSEMCLDQQNFIYPQICQLKFSSVKQGIFLMDNGLALYLYIAKTCDPQLLRQLFGKDKLLKTEHLMEDNIVESTQVGSQVINLIKVLREQKAIGWVPLYVVRCGEGSLNEKSFYLSFYAEKYQEFKTCKMTLSEFYATLGQQY